MSAQEWAVDITVFIALAGFCTAILRFYIKAILYELMPNSGNSLRDRIDKIETKQDHIYNLLIEANLSK
ncbi:hypothetical protein UFOVP1201_3 [uncultured Caudovirales phage]|uniref:Uncharacterized protein n=1 Tax=uncultured Caudovirales phage TaxID=2100421 RepID=A0A6J5NPG6_9CAUD|nr:hypothetical protein UFOVP788_23 [uncultured Caudovirales phage]CAB4189514.1 hypothetical protein UFOVP1201_3 [uncultured Caudovirales phage]